MSDLVLAGAVSDWADDPCKVVSVGDTPVLVLRQGDEFFAIDNRCPHMGFPLHRGDVHDGLLDCHWHHARFDVTCGATLDPWADDVDSYRVVLEDGNVYVDPQRPPRDPKVHGLDRIGRGLEHNLRLVTAKGAIELEQGGVPVDAALEAGARFGATQNDMGWSSGLTILSCMANVSDALEPADRARAVTKAVAWIAAECEGRPPRRPLPALEGTERDAAGLRAWLRDTDARQRSSGRHSRARPLRPKLSILFAGIPDLAFPPRRQWRSRLGGRSSSQPVARVSHAPRWRESPPGVIRRCGSRRATSSSTRRVSFPETRSVSAAWSTVCCKREPR